MSRIIEVIHAGKDRIDDHSGTTQQDAQTTTLESDRPTTPKEPQPTFPKRKFGDSSLSLPHVRKVPLTPGKVHRLPLTRLDHRQVPSECSQSSVTYCRRGQVCGERVRLEAGGVFKSWHADVERERARSPGAAVGWRDGRALGPFIAISARGLLGRNSAPIRNANKCVTCTSRAANSPARCRLCWRRITRS